MSFGEMGELGCGSSAASLMVGSGIEDGHTGPGAFAGGSRGGFADSWGIEDTGGGACCVEAGGFEGFDERGGAPPRGGCTGVVLCSGMAVRSDVPVKMP